LRALLFFATASPAEVFALIGIRMHFSRQAVDFSENFQDFSKVIIRESPCPKLTEEKSKLAQIVINPENFGF
jgi:hypothetical protein